MEYLGDFVEDFGTLSFKFLTKELRGSTVGNPASLTAGVISIYKDSGVTQSTAGVTLTVDFDSITGLNNVLIDLSSDVFYTPGSNYEVVITTGTVDAVSVVGTIISSFSIENRSLQKALAIVSNIATGAAAASVSSELAVITTGTEVNTYASTQNLDGGYHEISDVGGTLSMYYQFDINADNTATSIAMNGRMEGENDSIGVYAYNWTTTSWNQIGNLGGVTAGSPDGVAVFTVLDVHTGTGANLGLVRIRGLGTGLTSATLFIDRASMRYAPSAAPNIIAIRTEIDSNSTQLAAILADTNELQTDDIPATLATIASYIDTEIGTIITNLATVDTVVDGIQTDLSNGTDGLGALKALLDILDTVADSVKAKTDQLTFTKALELDVNAQSFNGSTIVGDGQATPWQGT